MAALDNFGNGAGYIYITDPSGTIFYENLNNDSRGAAVALSQALIAAPLSGQTLAFGVINITAVSGTGSVTSITVNGTQILSSTVTGTTVALLNANLAANIVAYTPTSTYTAYVSNGLLYVQAATGTGSTPNGYVMVVTATSTTFTNTNFSNGGSTGGDYSTGFNGKRFWLWADSVNAIPGSISGATEISSAIIQRGNQTGNAIISGSLSANSSGQLPVTRHSNFQIVIADTHSAAASGTMATMTTAGFVDGDMVQIRGKTASDAITIASGSGNQQLLLGGGVSWISGDASVSLTVEYSATLGQWVEVGRTPGLNFTTASVRGQGIPWAVPGVNVVTMSTGGTVSLTPGTDKGYQEITGSPTLASGYSVVGAGSPLDGDQFIVSYRATPTLSGQTVTIFGAQLTALQAVSGKILVRATYSTTNTAYDVDVFNDVTAVDWATLAQVNGKEPALGNPAVSGYVLASTTGGVRSWVANGGATANGVTFNNKVFVAKNGSDATGLVQRLDLPFLTIAAARAAATAFWTGGTAPSATNRILIDVMPGYYTEGVILDNFVDYNLNDCVIERQSGNFGTIDDNNVSCNSIILGQAVIRRTGTGTPGVGVQLTNAGSNIICNYSNLSSGIGYAVTITNGTAALYGPITAGGVTTTAGTVTINGNITTANTNNTISNTGATTIINGNLVQTGGADCASLTGGTTIINGNVTGSGSALWAVDCFTAGTHTVNGNISHTGAGSSGAVAIGTGMTLNINGNISDTVNASYAVHCNGTGTLNITGNTTSTTALSVGIMDDNGATVNYNSGIITSLLNAVAVTHTGAVHRYNNVRMVQTTASNGCVDITAAATVILKGCTMVSAASGHCVYGSANNVYIYGACEANLAAASVTQLVGTILVSSSVI